MEEKFVFPIGRKTWQILSLFALHGLAIFIIRFLFNLTPTNRDNVKVSRTEVINNQVDTVAVVKFEEHSNGCDPKQYKQYEDSLKSDLPKAEWTNLGDSSELFSEYYLNDYGDYVTDEYGNYIVVQKRTFYPNPAAIPNILENLFKDRSLDTSQICERVEILKLIHQLNLFTNAEYLNKEAFETYVYWISQGSEANLALVLKSAELKSKIDGKKLHIQNRKDLSQFVEYLEYVNRHSITEEKVDICLSLLDEHRKIDSPKYDKKKYFELTHIIFESDISTQDLIAAVEDFKDDLDYYDKNDLNKSLKRYLNLYEEKLSIAELEKSSIETEKAANRSFSILAIVICFASIISIATILLLFSIQQLLKDHTSSKETMS